MGTASRGKSPLICSLLATSLFFFFAPLISSSLTPSMVGVDPGGAAGDGAVWVQPARLLPWSGHPHRQSARLVQPDVACSGRRIVSSGVSSNEW